MMLEMPVVYFFIVHPISGEIVGQIRCSLIGLNPKWAFSEPQGLSRTKPNLGF